MTARGFVVALLGAESTGKTTLAAALADAYAGAGVRVAVVDEVLRAFCDARGRTPRRDEQRAIADEQAARIEAAAGDAELVIADTTALMVAVYSELVFGDTGLYDAALAAQRRIDLTLVCAIDLPWRADGLQRDGPHVRAPVDALVKAALERGDIAWIEVGGSGAARLEAARAAIEAARRHGR